jgi:putative ABC transport system permease protein
VQLDRPASQSVTVVGIARLRSNLDAPLVVVAPGTSLLGASGGSAFTYVDVDGAADPAGAAASLGDSARLSPRFDDRPTFADGKSAAVRWTWILGGLVLTVVGIVIASAFAASARRQLTTLGQLAANGASPDVLRRALFFQGTWTGAVGTLLGFGAGVAGLVVLSPHTDGLFQRDVGAYVVRVTDLVPIAVIGVAAATIAALVPARTTSRIPVLAALAGRRPLTKVPRWVTVAGFASIASGLSLLGLAVIGATRTNGPGTQNEQDIWAATAVLGGMAVLLGACAIAPAYVSLLDRVASRLSGSWRFAARSLARQRTRTGAVVSGLCAAGALAIGASALVIGAVGEQEQRDATLPRNEVHISAVTMDAERQEVTATPDAALVDDVAAVLPGADRIDLTAVAVRDGRVAVVADSAAIDVYDLSDKAQDALAAGGAIELRMLGMEDQQRPQQQFTEGGPMIDVTSVPASPERVGDLPRVLVSPALVEQLGLTPGDGPVVLRADHDLTDDEVGAIEDLRDDYYAAHPDDDPTPVPVPGGGERKVVRAGVSHDFTFVQTFARSDTVDAFVVEAILSAIAVGFALIVVAVSLALAAAETRDERDVLAIVGATPATMRRTSAQKAAILTVMGGLLAIPVGFLPVVVFTRADRVGGPLLVFPWRTVSVLVVAVPLITTAATTAASALALRLRPVRVSTMTFE